MSFNNRDRSGRDPDDGDDESSFESLEPPYDADEGCPKCGCPETRTSQLAAHSGGMSAAIDSPSQTFQVVSCLGCGYSELYKVRTDGDASGIVDTFLEPQD